MNLRQTTAFPPMPRRRQNYLIRDKPLHIAVKGNDYNKALDIYTDDPKTVLEYNEFGNTALHFAVLYSGIEMVQLFIGACPEVLLIQNNTASTPLHWATPHASVELVYNLLVAEPRAMLIQDKYGCTPLHAAASWGNRLLAETTDSIVSLLIDADPSYEHIQMKNNRDETALQSAIVRGKHSVATILGTLIYSHKKEYFDKIINSIKRGFRKRIDGGDGKIPRSFPETEPVWSTIWDYLIPGKI